LSPRRLHRKKKGRREKDEEQSGVLICSEKKEGSHVLSFPARGEGKEKGTPDDPPESNVPKVCGERVKKKKKGQTGNDLSNKPLPW